MMTEAFSGAVSVPTEVELILSDLGRQRHELAERAARRGGMPIHPLRIVKELQDIVSDDVTLCVDMGSFHIWIARYLYSFRARQLLISNGQQTMGVALPWAIGAALVRPGDKVVSISGDGGFMQSSMELETAVRLKNNIVHVIWVDNAYNMVEMQEVNKYRRKSGVEFGPIDFKAYAEACGAVGFAVQSVEDLRPMLRKAMEIQGPVVVAIPVDYADNYKLMAQMNFSQMI
ncbi:Acetolactate synthase, catabolic [compost metagenome]